MTYGSLFAGIGGFDLGFDRAGLKCKWQVEINEFCRRVLARHWPDVRRHDDVRTFPPTDPGEWRVDVICGGFPCQDISVAGKGAGIDGERSGLWVEYARIVRVLRPRFVVVENSPALLARGMGRVLGGLAACGYDAEWDCLPAAAVGAPHLRDRVYIVAHANGQPDAAVRGERAVVPGAGVGGGYDRGRGRGDAWRQVPVGIAGEVGGVRPDADGERREELDVPAVAATAGQFGRPHHADGVRVYPDRDEARELQARAASGGDEGRVPQLVGGRSGSWESWRTEPAVGRVADGVPDRVDRLRGLGNAVVPQVAEWIGRRLMEAAR